MSDYYADFKHGKDRSTGEIAVTVNPATIHIDLLSDDIDIDATLTIEEASTLFDELAAALEKVGKDGSR